MIVWTVAGNLSSALEINACDYAIFIKLIVCNSKYISMVLKMTSRVILFTEGYFWYLVLVC